MLQYLYNLIMYSISSSNNVHKIQEACWASKHCVKFGKKGDTLIQFYMWKMMGIQWQWQLISYRETEKFKLYFYRK